MTMYEVPATGMHLLYSQVCSEGILYPHKHTFRGCASYGVGRHSTSSTCKGFPTTSISGQVEVEAYVLALFGTIDYRINLPT